MSKSSFNEHPNETSSIDENIQRSKRQVKLALIASIVVITGVIGFTIATTFTSEKNPGDRDALEYFKHVDEVVTQAAAWQDRSLRLHGNVVTGTIQKKPDSLDYRFAMYHGNEWVEVNYQGLVPDTFRDCAEVVVNGKLSPDGKSFAAHTLTAKCPSKYDEMQRSKGCGESIKDRVVASRK